MSWGQDDVELAERYATALETIERLQQESSWGEDDVELAEKYATALETIERLSEE